MTGPGPLDIRDLQAGYGSTEILHGLDLVLEPGSRLTLLGPNGSGKTTLFRCILGFVRPTSGIVQIWGKDPLDPSGRDSALGRIGAVLENAAMPARITSLEWLEHQARLAGLRDARAAARNGLRSWDIPSGIESEKLSQGQRQRLTVLRCLFHDPDLLLLDEPAANLDPVARGEFWSHLDGWVSAKGATLLVSSHQLDETVQRDGDCAVIGDGRIVHRGPAREFGSAFATSRLLRLDRDTTPERLNRILEPVGARSILTNSVTNREFRIVSPDRAPDHPAVVAALVGAGLGVDAYAEDGTSLREAYRICLGGSEDAPVPAIPVELPPSRSSRPKAGDQILSWFVLHGIGLVRDRRLLIPFLALLVVVVGATVAALPALGASTDVTGLLALASILPTSLCAALAADLVAGERDRRTLENTLSQTSPYRRGVVGQSLSILAYGLALAWVAASAEWLALLRSGAAPSFPAVLAISFLFAPAALGFSIAAGLSLSLRSRTARSAAQLAALASLPVLGLAQALPVAVAGPATPWIAGASALCAGSLLLAWRISRNLSPERLLR